MLGHYTAANGPLAWLSYYTTLLSGAGVAVFHDLMSFPSLETLLRRANYRRRIIVECFFFWRLGQLGILSRISYLYAVGGVHQGWTGQGDGE